jgi:hypothetical protein
METNPETKTGDDQRIYLPTGGGSRFGSHYIGLSQDCKKKWFLRFRYPTEAGRGLESIRTAKPLLMGWGAHEGLAAYYLTGWDTTNACDTGQYDIDAACDHLATMLQGRASEFEDESQVIEVIEETQTLVRKYHDHYGPGGISPDYPDLQIMAGPEGEPLIERELECSLGYKDYVFTARIDGLAMYNGFANIFEHKTTAASSVGRLFQRMNIAMQATGQIFLVKNLMPDIQLNGCLVNTLVKNRSARAISRGESPFMRDITTRTNLELEKFRNDVVRELRVLEELEEEYTHLVSLGMSPGDAGNQVYTMNTSQCVQFSRCEFYGLCKSIGFENNMMGLYRPREVARQVPDPIT